jgi:hypothetical protein
MDRTILINRLYQAERHVASGDRHIERQRELIFKLKQDGHDTTQARALLTLFEELQALHLNERDRLAAQLDGQAMRPPSSSLYATE